MEEEKKIKIYKDLMNIGAEYSITPEDIVQVLKEMKPIYTRKSLNL